MLSVIQRVLRYPRLILLIALGSSIIFLGVIRQNMYLETDLDKYMPQEHPAFVFSDKAEQTFDIKDGILLAIENQGPQGVFTASTLNKIKDITKSLQKMPEIHKSDVTSLYTADNILGTDAGMDVRPFFKRVPEDPASIQDIRRQVLGNEMIFGRLVSENEKVSVIVAEIDDDVFSQEFYAELLALAQQFEGPEKVYVAGVPIVEGTMATLGPKDMKTMVPIVLLVIVIVLLFVTRSPKATLFTMLVVIFSTMWAFGLMAAMQIPMYAVSTMIPVMLIAIGVADGIHLYSHLHLYLRDNPAASRSAATFDMVRHMWKPVAMTSVTTAVGFISLLTSEVYPIKYFGIFTALGVLAAMMFSLTIIPAALLVFGLPSWKDVGTRREEKTEEDFTIAHRFTAALIRRKYATLAVSILVVAGSLYGMSKVWINSSMLDRFERDSDIVRTDAFVNQNFGGTSTINVVLTAGEVDTFKQPQVLRVIDKMQQDVDQSLEVVGNTFGLTDYLKRMNKVMHADKLEFDTIPESQDLVAQYLLLYEMSGDPENLLKVVDYDYKQANITFQLKSDNSKSIHAALAAISNHIPALESLGIQVDYAGSGYKGLVFNDLILEGQIKSLVLSLGIVFVLLALMFRNIVIGFVGSIPVVITACIGFGIMGLMNIALSTITALLTSIAIGIGIDYAVHFIERYRLYAEESNDKMYCAIHTMQHSGRAIIFNAVVVIAGFLVLLFSVFPPNRALGALVSLNMFTSFLGTVTIMFVVLYMSGIYFPKSSQRQSS